MTTNLPKSRLHAGMRSYLQEIADVGGDAAMFDAEFERFRANVYYQAAEVAGLIKSDQGDTMGVYMHVRLTKDGWAVLGVDRTTILGRFISFVKKQIKPGS